MTDSYSDSGSAAEATAESGSPDGERDSLRILRIVTDLYPEVMGGGALHAHKMSAMQASMGHDVTVLTSDHGDHELPREETREGYTLRRYRQVGRPFGNSITPGMVPDMWRLVDDADLIHAHSHLYFSTNLAAVLARIDDTPLVVTNHGLFSQSAPDWVQEVFMRTVARFTFNAADRIFCYTETDRERLRGRDVTAPISVIHNGIDCEVFTPEAAETEKDQVLFVGRLKEAKGVHWLVEAFAEVADEFPEASLKIVGDGPLRSQLERQIGELGLDGRVVLAGQMSNDELPRVYAESSVFALPSTAEGLPRTVLEALACETSVVTSELPQLESLVDGVGYTVPVGDSTKLASALRTLLTDSGVRSEMGARGRDRVVTQYSWEETVRETTAEYFEIV